MPGDAAGLFNGKPYSQRGGLGIFVDGALVGVRANINFVSGLGFGVTGGSDDAVNERTNILLGFNGEGFLGEVDQSNGDLTPGTLLETLVPEANLGGADWAISRVLVIARDIQGSDTQPSLEVGTDAPGNPPNNDVAAAQALTLTATGHVQELTLAAEQPILNAGAPNNLVRVRQTVAPGAGFTAYRVQIVAIASRL